MGGLISTAQPEILWGLGETFLFGQPSKICSGPFRAKHPLACVFPSVPIDGSVFFKQHYECSNRVIITLDNYNVLDCLMNHLLIPSNHPHFHHCRLLSSLSRRGRFTSWPHRLLSSIKQRQLLEPPIDLDLLRYNGGGPEYFNKWLGCPYPPSKNHDSAMDFFTRDIAATVASLYNPLATDGYYANCIYRRYFKRHNISSYYGATTPQALVEIGQINAARNICIGIEGTYYLAPDRFKQGIKIGYLALYMSLYLPEEQEELFLDMRLAGAAMGYNIHFNFQLHSVWVVGPWLASGRSQRSQTKDAVVVSGQNEGDTNRVSVCRRRFRGGPIYPTAISPLTAVHYHLRGAYLCPEALFGLGSLNRFAYQQLFLHFLPIQLQTQLALVLMRDMVLDPVDPVNYILHSHNTMLIKSVGIIFDAFHTNYHYQASSSGTASSTVTGASEEYNKNSSDDDYDDLLGDDLGRNLFQLTCDAFQPNQIHLACYPLSFEYRKYIIHQILQFNQLAIKFTNSSWFISSGNIMKLPPLPAVCTIVMVAFYLENKLMTLKRISSVQQQLKK